MNTYDLVKRQQKELEANGFKLVHANQGSDSTTILAFAKDGFEVTILIPGEEFKKHTKWEYLND